MGLEQGDPDSPKIPSASHSPYDVIFTCGSRSTSCNFGNQARDFGAVRPACVLYMSWFTATIEIFWLNYLNSSTKLHEKGSITYLIPHNLDSVLFFEFMTHFTASFTFWWVHIFVSVRGSRLEEEVELQARAPRRQAGARRREEERERAAQGPRRQPRLRQTQEDDTLGEQGG